MGLNKIKNALFLLSFSLIYPLFSSCTKWEYRPITNTENLEGRTIGVPLAWDADYIISERKDVKVIRYNTCADGFLALRHNKIDAFAVDCESAKLFLATGSGLKLICPVGKSNIAIWFSRQSSQCLKEFNEFLKKYRKSEEFSDLQRRKELFDGLTFDSDDIMLTGNGKILNVAFDEQNFPRTHYDDNGNAVGIDLEALKYFANEYNYKLVFHNSVYESSIIGMRTGKYDIMAGYLCDLYETDAKDNGILFSDAIDEIELALIEKTQEKIEISVDY